MNKQKHPKHHVAFVVCNIIVFFVLLGGWLIYHMLTDSFVVAGF